MKNGMSKHWMVLLLSLSVFAISTFYVEGAGAKYSPVIFVPGLGGSRLYAKTYVDHPDCPVGHDWSLIWLNLRYWLSSKIHCLLKYLKLYYNVGTHQVYKYPSMRIQTRDWGTTKSIDYLGYAHIGFQVYFAPLTKYLIDHGFVQNVSVRGAPYDFRLTPNENPEFSPKLAALIEDTYNRNGQSPVVLLAHSMGNLYVNYFLSRMPHHWKDKFVRGYIAVAPPIGGAVKSVLAETYGIQPLGYFLNMTVVRATLRSLPSITFNFPRPHFWGPDEIFAQRPGRNYSLSNLKTLFEDIKHPKGWAMYQDASKVIDPFWKPDVKLLYCIYGTGVPTAQIIKWTSDKAFPDKEPTIIYGPGDGTVNLRSLRGCLRWPRVKLVTYPGAKHEAVLHNHRFQRKILDVLKL